MDAPVIGAHTTPYSKPKTFDVFTSWRYQKSDRHFVGDDYQENRDEEGSQVINWINLFDVSLRWNLSDRTSIALSIPYFTAERSSPIRDADRVVIDRSKSHAAGFGDIILAYRRWMLSPEDHPKGNFLLGGGIKVPTGPSAVNDVRKFRNADTDEIEFDVRAVDQSIQPGDGGWGFLLDGAWFLRLGEGNAGFYASGSYLFNPREVNEVNRFSTNPITEYFSVSDQYLVRGGFNFAVPSTETMAGAVGIRWEGVPSEDAIGGSLGFRRPGYAVSIEPSFSYGFGSNVVAVGVPIAVYRNRTASVNDEINNNGEPGDAAFADWLLMVSFGHHFDFGKD